MGRKQTRKKNGKKRRKEGKWERKGKAGGRKVNSGHERKRKDRKNELAIKFKNGEERKEREGCARKTCIYTQ